MLCSAENLVTRVEAGVADSPTDPRPFEGVEKKLTLRYSCTEGKTSIRKRVEEDFWRQMVTSVGASVLNVVRNDVISAFLLSESSLFVFDDQIILKTCGNTRIFDALGILTKHIRENVSGLDLVEIVYSRPTFMFPDLQPGIYGDFTKEVTRLSAIAKAIPNTSWKVARKDSQPNEGLVFHCCVLTNTSTKLNWKPSAPPSTDIALFFPNSERLTLFFDQMELSEPESASEEITTPARNPIALASGLAKFLPFFSEGFQADEHLFEPCGYSMNAIRRDEYWTIHVTPESEFSYLSFETNSPHIADLTTALLEFYTPKKNVVCADNV